MEEFLSANTLITLVGMAASVLVSVVSVRFRVKSLEDRTESNEEEFSSFKEVQKKENSAMWAKADDVHSRLSIVESKTGTLSRILNPDKLEERAKWEATVQCKLENIEKEVKK